MCYKSTRYDMMIRKPNTVFNGGKYSAAFVRKGKEKLYFGFLEKYVVETRK
jgi:hypothetical protein